MNAGTPEDFLKNEETSTVGKKDEFTVAGWNYGWICPRCGAGNAPYSIRCACTPYPQYVVTC